MVSAQTLQIDLGFVNHQTLGDAVKELIEVSYYIYQYLLNKPYQSTLVCGGQSPAYYCLAIQYFPIYQPDKVDIVILPHSKFSQKTTHPEIIYQENYHYKQRLLDNKIVLKKHVTIVDMVHSGTGILALQDALQFTYPDIIVDKIAINSCQGIAKIPVDKEVIARSITRFSDIFPRLVDAFYPRNFHQAIRFPSSFHCQENILAQMIISIADNYVRDGDVQLSPWYLLNNQVTKEIQGKKDELDEFISRRGLYNYHKMYPLIPEIY